MENIYNTKLICIKSGSDMSEAKDLMDEKRIRHLPVVAPDNRITGILSAHDMTDVTRFQELPVDLFASFPVEFVGPEAALSEVADRMMAKKISCLIIADRGEATGLITTDDLLFELSKMLKEKEKNTGVGAAALMTAGELFKKLADIGI